MKVLQVYRDYFTKLPGGIERHVHDLAHGLQGLGSIEVLASNRARRSSVEHDGPVRVHLTAELFRIQGLSIAPGMRGVLKRGGFDLVHVHSPNPPGEALLLSRAARPSIVTYHADLHRAIRLFPVYRRWLFRTLSICRRIIVSSDRFVATSPVLNDLVAGGKTVDVVPFGVDLERFAPRDSQRSAELRASWGTGPFVLYLGRLRYYKGLGDLLRAMHDTDASLVIAGGGPEYERIKDAGGKLLGPRLIMLGRVRESDLADVYRAADMFCLPSSSSAETFGISTLEAMASGLPVVTTEVGTATSEVNLDGETGLVVPPSSADALSTAIQKVLSDPSLAESLGTAARARAETLFDKKTMLERVAKIYTEVLTERD